MTDPGESLARLLAALVRQHSADGKISIFAVSGPQGSGKSTVAACLARQLSGSTPNIPVLSLDDFYLTKSERQNLARTVHPLLATRGPPGTHDLNLAEHVIRELQAGRSLRLPSFDKAHDDRRPESQWRMFVGPAPAIILEGWCLGAHPVPATELLEPINDLEREEDVGAHWRLYVNNALARYQPLFERIDRLFLLRPPSFGIVSHWREEQEIALRVASRDQPGAACMNPAEVKRFIQFYERITRRLIVFDVRRGSDIVINLNADRTVRSVE